MPAVLWPDGSATIPTVTSEYNPARKNPVTGIVQPHEGIDIVNFDRIIAPTDGVVTFAGYNGGAGLEVRIRSNGPNAFTKGDTYRMLHNRELWVRTRQTVRQGDIVALMGSTGNSTGKHCHFETRPGGGSAINPRQYMADRNATSAGEGTTPAPVSPKPKELKVLSYSRQDHTARNGGRQLAPGANFHLNTTPKAPPHNATNIVGGIGPYSITVHVYAEGTPGDVVEVMLLWQNVNDKPIKSSAHYTERLTLDRDGKVRANFEFKRGVEAGGMVLVRLDAVATNRASVKVTCLDSDAYLFVAA
ncbi:M23 family metallopeptidase [Microbacterium sp. NPDC089696]|uniref:M23 family metallopeptidase n=1 Tax=Microbacterium sp. NPDC089696 TaxID=3364199 RepID=UPI0038288788